jgi:hypothetical protein
VKNNELFNLYGDCIRLGFNPIEDNLSTLLNAFENNWVHYNKKKPYNNRQGLSLTSLDGGLSGHPDLDSVKEYNEIHNLKLDEIDFCTKTPVVEKVASVQFLMNQFESVGRSHFIRFGYGGFFPYHRDGNFSLPTKSFRIFCLAHGKNKYDFCWLQENTVLPLIERDWYLINTLKEHAVFTFNKDVLICVINIPNTAHNINTVLRNLKIN